MKCIVQINTLDIPGGAARIASMLHGYFNRNGFESKMIVGTKLGNDPDTIELISAIKASTENLPFVSKCIRNISLRYHVRRYLTERRNGTEDLGNPASRYLFEILPDPTDLILCHNLHGGYFDLNLLPLLSNRYPVVLLMHDPWLLAGHCAHSFECEKWIDGCSECRNLGVQYALQRDTSHINWLRKKNIYNSSRIYVITPSQWLMDKVERSMLKPAVVHSKVINNGVDPEIFSPGDKGAVRTMLGFDHQDHIVMFAANGIRESIWKDYATMRAAVCAAALAMPEKRLRFIAVGESAPDERIGPATINFISHKTTEEMVCYYQATDVYIHAAKAENFPNTIIEALSCGTPVIATAVGGVPEQVKGLRYEGDVSGLNHYDQNDATGILTPIGDVKALSDAICHVLTKPEILQRLSVSAARDAKLRFNLNTIGGQYHEFLEDVIADWKSHMSGMQ